MFDILEVAVKRVKRVKIIFLKKIIYYEELKEKFKN